MRPRSCLKQHIRAPCCRSGLEAQTTVQTLKSKREESGLVTAGQISVKLCQLTLVSFAHNGSGLVVRGHYVVARAYSDKWVIGVVRHGATPGEVLDQGGVVEDEGLNSAFAAQAVDVVDGNFGIAGARDDERRILRPSSLFPGRRPVVMA